MHIFEKTGVKDRFELAVHGRRLLGVEQRPAEGRQPAAGSVTLATKVPFALELRRISRSGDFAPARQHRPTAGVPSMDQLLNAAGRGC